jgi:hypothetical protein
MRRRLPSSSPIFAAAGFIAFWLLATLWNWDAEPFSPKLKLCSVGASFAVIAGTQMNARRIEVWANSISGIQELVQASGKGFAYLEYLPATLNCPTRAKCAWGKLGPDRSAPESRHILYDAAAGLIQTANPDYPIDLFPRDSLALGPIGLTDDVVMNACVSSH